MKLWDNIKWSVCGFFHKLKRVFTWLPTIWNDRDWDSAFMLEIEQKKLKQMCKYLEENDYGCTVDGWHMYREMKLCINLLDIVLEKDDEWWNIEWQNTDVPTILTGPREDHKYKFTKYVNIKNWKRFLPFLTQKMLDREPDLWRVELRPAKAWALYCEIRRRSMRNWWD